MADFALGLTKTAVEGTLSKVKLAVDEEAKLKVRVQNDLLFITGEFQMMQSFLRVANKERANNEVVKTWVRQVRDLAFDVEDCVEFVVHLDNESAWGWLRRFWHMVYCLAGPLPLDEAVADIKQLKLRVEEVSQRNTRYKLISDSESKHVPAVENPASAASSSFHMVHQVWEAAGKMRDVGNLQELITTRESFDDLQVISLWGSKEGDPGVTSIFRKAYCDPKICEQFKNRAWVKMIHPFIPDEFLRTLLTQFYACSGQATEDVQYHKKAELMQQVNEQRYLVILEEVSTVVDWNAIRMCLPNSKNGSRIIVSTQDLGIAIFCTGEPYLVSKLGQYSDAQSLCAFFNKDYWGPSPLAMFLWRLKYPGVMSIYMVDDTRLVHHLLYGVSFEHRSWVNISNPLDLKKFSQDLFLNFYSDVDKSRKVAEVNKMDESGLIQRCCEFLREFQCLVVIYNLQSTEDWKSIKTTFLSEPIKACIVVTTTEGVDVAAHCADPKYLFFNANDLEAEATPKEYRVSKKRRGQEARRWNDKNKLVGFRREKAELGRLLRGVRYAEKNCLSQHLIISVWGIAGVGKSALIKSIYYEKMQPEKEPPSPFYNMLFRKFEVEAKFFSWVDVPHPFSLPDFSRRLLLDFHSDDIEAKEIAAVGIMEGQDPMEECRRKFLRQGSCFVVIDGLDSKYDWDLIKAAFLSERTEKACIIVITREESVATYCADKQKEKVVNVTGLETEVALGLFTQVSWDNKDLTEDKKQISERIVAKCGGLPKLITAIGNHVSEQPNYSLKSLNDDFMGKLETNPEVPGLRGLFSWMHSYFDACSDYLKPCIFYLSVFSADRNIRRGRLLRRWMAEGYSRDSTIGTAEKQCETFFSELVRLSIIQHRRGRVSCHVNGFFHEYIRSRPMEDNLVFALEGFCRLNSQRTGQHLTIRSCWNRDKTVFASLDFSRLRSFTVSGEWRPFFMSANNNMRLLRVLDLEDTSGLANDDLRQVGKLVPRLKFLSLRGCRGITNLPDSVGDLRQLQTLDVRNTSVVTLPRAIIKLHKLRYICAGTTEPWDVGGTGMVTSRPGADEECDGTGTSQPQPAAASPIPEEDGAGMSQSEPAPAVTGVVGTPPPSRDWSNTLLSSWLSIFQSRPQLDNVGVKVPLEIGKLAALHTLGVVDISGAGGKDILKELKKLTQLHKLRVSGVNKENYLEIFSAIMGHVHLESLSVRLDKEKHGWLACLDGVPLPPKSIKKLKLYGYVHKMPIWVNQLDRLEKLDLEMTIMTQEDIDVIEELPRIRALRRLCVKPTIQDGKLSFGPWRSFKTYNLGLLVLKIDCTSSLEVTFQEWITEESVEQLILHCSRGSSLQITGIKNLKKLKQVWLKGSYGDAIKQSLQGQIDDLPVDEGQEKPILKLEQINGC